MRTVVKCWIAASQVTSGFVRFCERREAPDSVRLTGQLVRTPSSQLCSAGLLAFPVRELPDATVLGRAPEAQRRLRRGPAVSYGQTRERGPPVRPIDLTRHQAAPAGADDTAPSMPGSLLTLLAVAAVLIVAMAR